MLPVADEYVPATQATQLAEDDVFAAAPRVPLGQRVGVVIPLGQCAFLGRNHNGC